MSGDPSDISKQQRALRATTAERLEAIVEAAERAAEGVIDDAEAQARRYLAQARAEADRIVEDRGADLSELVDSLLGQVLTLRQEAERLQATLEAAKARIEAPEAPEREAQPAGDRPRAPRLRAVRSEEPPASEPPAEPAAVPAPEERRADAAGARLLATQLAVQGSSREEIEQRLRNGFEIEDTNGILDAILGPEADSDA
jgi:vacuolar-type H+-ATPase subunit H